MKAIILAAGIGTGFKPITEIIPKPLIPIANRPILEQLIRTLDEVDVSEIFILVGHLQEQVREFTKKLNKLNTKIDIIPAINHEKGPIYTFSAAKDLHLKQDFLLSPADLFLSRDIITNLIRFHEQGTISIAADSSKPMTGGTEIFSPAESIKREPGTGFNFGKVSGIKKRISYSSGASYLAIPLMVCTPDLFNHVEEVVARNETAVVSALKSYIEKLKPMNFLDLANFFWFDIDNLYDLLIANEHALRHRIVPGNGIFITEAGLVKDLDITENNKFHPTTKIMPPVLIGKDCVANKNSEIGPFVSLGDNSVVGENSRVENSITFGNARVPDNFKIKNALIHENNIISINQGKIQ